MKITNFKLIEVTGTSPIDWKFKASIDVTTGFLKKKTETVEIYKEYACNWFFLESGKFVPGTTINNLERSFTGKHGEQLENCLDNKGNKI